MKSTIGRFSRYFYTIRHLRPRQIYGRVWFHLLRPKPQLGPAPQTRELTGAWASPAQRPASLLGPATFRFLNETRTIADWNDPLVPLLWRYNLHYFDDLNAEGSVRRTDWHHALISRWIAENPPARENRGWDPYPTSLRMVNWIKWSLAGNHLAPEVVHSLAVQARWLSRRLEHHLQGNHLFANAKALLFAGGFFVGHEADRWREQALQLLARQVQEQILPDGGQFELSTMYHALALEDLLDLVNLGRSVALPVPGNWEALVAAMRDWLATMSHPDGEISFFNDAAIGIAPPPAELDRYASDLGFPALAPQGVGCHALPHSGYVRLCSSEATLMLDVAQVGPDHLPGHAHADTLSFELSVHGRRAIVNSGTSEYGRSPERLRQRGTAAHNTVVVEGENSSEVWSGFRVARRARPTGLTVREASSGWVVACGHDGYRRLRGRPDHHRTWTLAGRSLGVVDRVSGPSRPAVAVFHFHPDLVPVPNEDSGAGQLQRCGITALRWRIDEGSARVETSTWHPEFGVAVANHRLVVELVDNASTVEFSWE